MTAPLSIEEIERLEALEKAAQPSPWNAADLRPFSPQSRALIAALRNAAPALLAMARSLHATVQESVEASNKARDESFATGIRESRYLAALKAEAIAQWQTDTHKDFGDGCACVGGITFRVTRGPNGELTAEEVQE